MDILKGGEQLTVDEKEMLFLMRGLRKYGRENQMADFASTLLGVCRRSEEPKRGLTLVKTSPTDSQRV